MMTLGIAIIVFVSVFLDTFYHLFYYGFDAVGTQMKITLKLNLRQR